MEPTLVILVAAGGAIGAVLRFCVSSVKILSDCGQFPCNTLLINIVGCFLMGCFAESLKFFSPESMESARAFLMIGFLGGFTTLSAFALEFGIMYRTGFAGMALFYAVVTYTTAPLAFFSGAKVLRIVFNL